MSSPGHAVRVASLGIRALTVVLLAAGWGAVHAQLNPLSIIGQAVSTALDVRTKAEVAVDAEIAASANKRLIEDKKAEWSGVTLLVFAQHVVIAGAVKDAAAKARVEAVVKADKRIRSLKNELRVGDVASLVGDTTVGAKIDAVLTSTEGIASVNMRWKSVGGEVVLMGVAGTPAEAALAVSKIRGIGGVKAVKSHLRVVARKKAADGK